MLPFIEWTTIDLGFFSLQVWGLFVALGFLLGGIMAGWLAKRQGQDPKVVYDLLPWLILSGLVGGRLGHVLLYDFSYYRAHLLEALAIWHGGLSIFGGLIAGTLATVIFFRLRRVNFWQYASLLAFGLPFGMWLGRIGCFLIHDHPGTATHFLLGVKYPDGIVRHDLGLYESINGFLLAVVFLWLARRPRNDSFYLAAFSVWYGATRFFLDFYRVENARWWGLTPAQYLSITLFVFGCALTVWINHKSKLPKTTKLTKQQSSQ